METKIPKMMVTLLSQFLAWRNSIANAAYPNQGEKGVNQITIIGSSMYENESMMLEIMKCRAEKRMKKSPIPDKIKFEIKIKLPLAESFSIVS